MGSVGESPPVKGKFMHPVITPTTTNGDPWLRNYFAPPQLEPLAARDQLLVDVRPLLSRPGYSPSGLLKSHGFGVVRHHSALLDHLDRDGDLAEHAVSEEYHSEIEELVKETTGAKVVIITHSVLRLGQRKSVPWTLPTALPTVTQATTTTDDTEKVSKAGAEPAEDAKSHKLARQDKLKLAAPVRSPHMDVTPLGARQSIRCTSEDIYEIALQKGVIAYEDQICERHAVSACSKESDAIISENYNANGNPGPRYAAYSIWRPLKKVERDPISFAPRKESSSVAGNWVHWPYLNRIPGPAVLSGDFLKEYAMLGVKGEAPASANGRNSDDLKWHYVSAQTPDEVIFIKLFDTASLGSQSEHAGAPWHASPEIEGTTEEDEPRESIDVRLLAFW